MDRDEIAKAIYPEIAEARDFNSVGVISWDDAAEQDRSARDAAYAAADRVIEIAERYVDDIKDTIRYDAERD